MFLRRLTVMFIPLVLLFALIWGLPYLNTFELGFFTGHVKGGLLGLCLGLIVPLVNASKRKEPFAPMLWLPALALLAVMVYQYLETRGIRVPSLHFLATRDEQTLYLESVFLSYMAVHCIRTLRSR